MTENQRRVQQLVEKGILNKVDLRVLGIATEKEEPFVAYFVVDDKPKHEHRYAVFYAKCTSDRLALVCAIGTDEECTEVRFIPNLSPFEVPE